MVKFCSQCGDAVQPTDSFCTSCGEEIMLNKQQNKAGFKNKKAIVLGHAAKSKTSHKTIFGTVVVIILFGIWSFVQSLPDKGNPLIKKQPVVSSPINYPPTYVQMANIQSKIDNGKIIVPLNIVKENKFVTFLYNSQSGTLPLLAYISNEGKLITAVSMCEPCNSTRFRINGSRLVCNSCSSTWDLNNLSEISGACGDFPPDVIPSVVVGNEIRIDESVVNNWRRRI